MGKKNIEEKIQKPEKREIQRKEESEGEEERKKEEKETKRREMKIEIMLTGERESVETEVFNCISTYLCVHFLKNQSRKTYF